MATDGFQFLGLDIGCEWLARAPSPDVRRIALVDGVPLPFVQPMNALADG